MYDAVYTEARNKPTVALVNQNFLLDARSAASSKGMPGIRVIPETVPCECSVVEEIESKIDAVIPEIIRGLTECLTPQEQSPVSPETRETTRIIFKGNLQEVNQFFYRRGWGDGLPLVPPTEEAVKEMLTGTDLPPDHLAGKILPRQGKATVEKIAINAVMAGAMPTYMPVILAGMAAILDPRAFFPVWSVSTGAWAPCWIINGPVRLDLNINSGSGVLSPGNIANAAIGRAMGLIIKNIGGIRPGIEDMGVQGNTSKYSMVIAENEEENPWQPLHVEHGFKKEDSAVTLFFPNCNNQIMPFGTDADGIIRGITCQVPPGRRGLFLIALNPVHAKIVADKGWSKQEIITYISEFARVPVSRHPSYNGGSLIALPKAYRATDSADSAPLLENPAWIRIIVAGGPGNFTGMYGGSCWEGGDWVTHKVNLPAGWNSLVNKYKNIVPTYAMY